MDLYFIIGNGCNRALWRDCLWKA